jgi:hypothetical protein
MWYDVIEQKLLVPGIKIEGGDVADLPVDPVPFGKTALGFAEALPQEIVANVDTEDGKIPEVGSFS